MILVIYHILSIVVHVDVDLQNLVVVYIHLHFMLECYSATPSDDDIQDLTVIYSAGFTYVVAPGRHACGGLQKPI